MAEAKRSSSTSAPPNGRTPSRFAGRREGESGPVTALPVFSCPIHASRQTTRAIRQRMPLRPAPRWAKVTKGLQHAHRRPAARQTPLPGRGAT
jgi:hypothetical protein